MDDLLHGYEVVLEFPIRWGDMDAFGHVNNARYFTYFESARIAYVERIGFMDLMGEIGVGPILASTDCRFRLPLTYPDIVRVGTRVTKLGADRFFMAYRLVSLTHGAVAAEGQGLIVTFDYRKGAKAPVPETIRARILGLDNPDEM